MFYTCFICCCIHVLLSPDIAVYIQKMFYTCFICCIHVLLTPDIVVYKYTTKDVLSTVVYNDSLKDVFTTSQKKRIYI